MDRPRYGVAGDPVAHSKSPAMHAAAYAELGLDADYQLLPLTADLFAETVRALPESGFRGINVTIPHKAAALAVADTASDAAKAIGAANTLTFEGGAIHADNTDAPGMIAAIDRDLTGVSALVLGAGGTARAAVWALRDAGAEVEIWNRTAERAAALAEEFGVVSVTGTDGGAGRDVIVNTTAAGMGGDEDEDSVVAALALDLASIRPDAIVVDFVYRGGGSPLTTAARAHGLSVVDGPELLAQQGALSFEIWWQRPAPLATMRAALLNP